MGRMKGSERTTAFLLEVPSSCELSLSRTLIWLSATAAWWMSLLDLSTVKLEAA